MSNSGQAPAVFKTPPHPNATKVFVNWLLSQPTQAMLQREQQNNSTRKDVPVSQAENKPKSGVPYYHTQTEEAMTQVTTAAQRYARELLPSAGPSRAPRRGEHAAPLRPDASRRESR